MGKERKDRKLGAGKTEEGTAKGSEEMSGVDREKSPNREGKKKRKVQWQEKGAKAGEARSEAEDEQAIEELLRDCQEKARNYEPGGATAVEKVQALLRAGQALQRLRRGWTAQAPPSLRIRMQGRQAWVVSQCR